MIYDSLAVWRALYGELAPNEKEKKSILFCVCVCVVSGKFTMLGNVTKTKAKAAWKVAETLYAYWYYYFDWNRE